MSQEVIFSYKTRGNSTSKDKPSVYFTCHPEDFGRYFEKICEDIFKTHDCAIYYTDDTTADEVFMLLLITAVKNNIPQEELPETIYIISDMEFDRGVNRDQTVFEDAKEKYEDYGYHLPRVVYWNVDSRHQQFPVDMNEKVWLWCPDAARQSLKWQ